MNREKIEFIDLKAQQKLVRDRVDSRIAKVLDHGQYINGPEVTEFETKLATFVGVKHCIGMANGTDALMVALMALGVKAGDEVITTPFTFIATGETIAILGAVPVFVDIDPRTYNIDPSKIECAITNKTRAIMPVSLYGQCADMDAINAIAKKHRIPVIEDAAQSLGATYWGRQSGSLSTIATTSFFPSKSLGAYGDAGAAFTDDDALATQLRWIRNHGQDRRYHHVTTGVNSRLDTIQAAILLAKLEIFSDEIVSRDRIGKRYNELLKAVVKIPYVETHNTSVFAQYTIQVENRDEVQKAIEGAGVPTSVHYPIPLNLQPAFKHLNEFEGSFPVSEAAARHVLSLPMHPYLSASQQDEIVGVVADVCRKLN